MLGPLLPLSKRAPDPLHSGPRTLRGPHRSKVEEPNSILKMFKLMKMNIQDLYWMERCSEAAGSTRNLLLYTKLPMTITIISISFSLPSLICLAFIFHEYAPYCLLRTHILSHCQGRALSDFQLGSEIPDWATV